MHYPLRLVLALGLVAALAGCAPTATPTGATNTPTAAATNETTSAPSETPAPAAVPSRIIISSTDVQIVRDDGTVAQTISYFDPIAPAVDTFTELLGAAPVVNNYDGTGAADYQWDGFRLRTDGPALPPIHAEIYVTATTAEMNGLQIVTTEAIQVGDDLRALAAADPENSSTYFNGSGETLSVDVMSVPVEEGDTERAFHTGLSADPADGVIDQIHAPEKNFE